MSFLMSFGKSFKKTKHLLSLKLVLFQHSKRQCKFSKKTNISSSATVAGADCVKFQSFSASDQLVIIQMI